MTERIGGQRDSEWVLRYREKLFFKYRYLSIVYSLVYSELHKKLKKEVRFDNIDYKRKTKNVRQVGRCMGDNHKTILNIFIYKLTQPLPSS
jgi:hypothetical protein